MKRMRNRKEYLLPEVNVIPLIDVSLMLLLVFMVTAPILQRGIKVELPQGAAQEVKGMSQDLVLFLDKDNALFFNDEKVLLPQLISRLQMMADRSTIFIKADRTVSYGRVIELVDQLKTVGGGRHVALATQRSA